MNIVHIIGKELRSRLRDKRTFLFMIAFPIVLMIILGTALSNTFSSDFKIGDMTLLYKDGIQNRQLEGYWQEFAKVVTADKIKLVPLPAGTDGKEDVRKDYYTAYVELSDEGIIYYGGTRHAVENNVLQGTLAVFADKYNLTAAALQEDPAIVQKLLKASASPAVEIQETALNKDKKPGSVDYYAVAMSTMIAFYSCLSGVYLIRGERTRKTGLRLSAAPVTKGEIFAGKVISSTLVNFIFVLVVVLFSKFVLKADWGQYELPVLLVLLSEVLLGVSIGLGCSYLFKEGTDRSLLLIFTQVASFLGGAYFPVGDANGIMAFFVNLSPMRWANQAINQIIYSNQWQAAFPAMALNIGVGVVFLIFSAFAMNRREEL